MAVDARAMSVFKVLRWHCLLNFDLVSDIFGKDFLVELRAGLVSSETDKLFFEFGL